MAPSTPGIAHSHFHGIIDISDDEVNYNEIPKVKKVSGSRTYLDLTKSHRSSDNDLLKTNLEHIDEHTDEYKFHSLTTRSAKGNQAAKIITIDDEDIYDEHEPKCTLNAHHNSRVMTYSEEEVKVNVSRRPLTRLRKLESKNKEDKSSLGLNKTVNLSDDEEDKDAIIESASEGETLGGFIVDSSESVSYINEKVREDVNAVSTGTKEAFRSQLKKWLPFEEDGCPNKKMEPSTPSVAQSPFHGIIDISDEDVNYNEIPKVKKVSGSRKYGDLGKSQCSSENNLQKTNLEHINDEFRFHSSNTGSAKRKRAANIITSDDEGSNDENVQIYTRKTQHSSRVMTDSEEEMNENVSRRHVTRLRKQESKNKEDKSSIDLNKAFDSSEDEEDDDGVDENESEGESLGGFIVDSSESVSNYESESIDSADESEDLLNEYKETLEKIGRKKITNFEWVLMGDMLSDFAKDPELRMSAVCAIYRRQTYDEKSSKKTKYQNERGFSKTDASRGGKLAEFLMDGDDGDVNKTVEELKEYDANGIKLCRKLAFKYSKQLWQIYLNKEDPYFPPQR